MSERIVTREQLSYIALAELCLSDTLVITTGEGDNAWTYNFVVEEPSQWPKGSLSATNPEGEIVEPTPFTLCGAGQWTTRQQNPVQDQDRGFSSYWHSIYTGGIIVGRFEGHADKTVFDGPGQVITSITIQRS